jgi:hypothetical protein
MPGAGNKVQAAGLIGTVSPESASGAEVSGIEQPDAGESHIFARRNTGNNGTQDFG